MNSTTNLPYLLDERGKCVAVSTTYQHLPLGSYRLRKFIADKKRRLTEELVLWLELEEKNENEMDQINDQFMRSL